MLTTIYAFSNKDNPVKSSPVLAYWKIFVVVRRQSQIAAARHRTATTASEPVPGTSAAKKKVNTNNDRNERKWRFGESWLRIAYRLRNLAILQADSVYGELSHFTQKVELATVYITLGPGTSVANNKTATNAGPTLNKGEVDKGEAGAHGRRDRGGGASQNAAGLSQAEINVMKTVAYIIVCFIVCLLPSNLYFVYQDLSVRNVKQFVHLHWYYVHTQNATGRLNR